MRGRALRSPTFDREAEFYVHNGLFWVKMGLLALLLALETRPMITFIRWRLAGVRGGAPEIAPVMVLARINDIEVVLVVLMARDVWLFT